MVKDCGICLCGKRTTYNSAFQYVTKHKCEKSDKFLQRLKIDTPTKVTVNNTRTMAAEQYFNFEEIKTTVSQCFATTDKILHKLGASLILAFMAMVRTKPGKGSTVYTISQKNLKVENDNIVIEYDSFHITYSNKIDLCGISTQQFMKCFDDDGGLAEVKLLFDRFIAYKFHTTAAVCRRAAFGLRFYELFQIKHRNNEFGEALTIDVKISQCIFEISQLGHANAVTMKDFYINPEYFEMVKAM